MKKRNSHWKVNLLGGAATLPVQLPCASKVIRDLGKIVLPVLCERWGLSPGSLSFGRHFAIKYVTGAGLKLFHWDVDSNQYGNLLVGLDCTGATGGTTFFGNGRFKLQLKDADVACWRNYKDGELLKDACHGVSTVSDGERYVLTARINCEQFKRPGDVKDQADQIMGTRKRKFE